MNKGLFTFLIVITTSLMGSSFAIGKIGLNYISPLLLVGIRFTLAGLLMGVAVRLFKRKHPGNLRQWLQIMLIGLFQTAGVMGLVFISMRTITAGETSILTFTNPLLVVIFGTLFLRKKYYWTQWAGVAVGFTGVFITLGANLDVQQIGTFLGFLSSVSWAIATLLMKRWGAKLDVWVITAYQMLTGGVFLLILSSFFEKVEITITASSIFIVLWLAIMASIVQFAVWFFLLQNENPGKVSSFLFLAPLFGVLSGWLLLGEQLYLSTLVGGSIILVGIYLVNRPKSS